MVGCELPSQEITWANPHGSGNRATCQPGSLTSDLVPWWFYFSSSLTLQHSPAVHLPPGNTSHFLGISKGHCAKFANTLLSLFLFEGEVWNNWPFSGQKNCLVLSYSPVVKSLCFWVLSFAVNHGNTKGGEKFPLLSLWACLCQLHSPTSDGY